MMETDNRYAKKGEEREIIKEGNESRGGAESGCPLERVPHGGLSMEDTGMKGPGVSCRWKGWHYSKEQPKQEGGFTGNTPKGPKAPSTTSPVPFYHSSEDQPWGPLHC